MSFYKLPYPFHELLRPEAIDHLMVKGREDEIKRVWGNAVVDQGESQAFKRLGLIYLRDSGANNITCL